MIKIINIFSKGNDECKHDKWVYDAPSKILFTSPQIAIQKRVCECCGRLEEVKVANQVIKKFAKDEFNDINNKFNAKD